MAIQLILISFFEINLTQSFHTVVVVWRTG